MVISVFNGEERLSAALDSILGQSFADLECIIVDDGSQDSTPEILQCYASRDARVRVHRQDNQGLTRSLVTGCAMAQGCYIARHDADDVSHPDRFVEQLALLDRIHEVGFVASATRWRAPGGEELGVVRREADPVRATEALLHRRLGPPAHGSVMMRRSVYEAAGGYRREFHFAQDADLWLRMAEISSFACLPDIRYDLLRDPASISGRWRPYQQRFGHIAEACGELRRRGEDERPLLEVASDLSAQIVRIRAGSNPSDSDSVLRRAMATAYHAIGAELLGKGDPAARGYLLKALRADPIRPRTWVRLLQSLLPITLRGSRPC